MRAGVLALQGAITPHLQMLDKLGVDGVRVTGPEHLPGIERIILPGGESTTILKLLDRAGLWDDLVSFCRSNPVWGTCAGAILLAKEVYHPAQRSFKVMDISAERNAYGSQRESFKIPLRTNFLEREIEVDFIRAPRLRPLTSNVSVLAEHEGDSVLLRQGNLLVSAFHSELGADTSLHEYFLKLQ